MSTELSDAVKYPSVRTELPGPASAALMARNDAVMYGPYRGHDTVPLYIERKSEWLIEDVDGNSFVDHVSAWGSNPLGALPPTTLERTVAAMHHYGFEITDYVRSPPPIRLAERLVELAPPNITRVATGITGTEVVEGAVKLAREATGRPMILGFLGQYHGETTYLTAAGSTDLSEVTSNSAQYVSGLVFAPYPNRFRAPFHKGPGPYDDTIYVDYLEEVLLRHQVDPEQIAGVLIEPVLGEGGIVIPSAAFWDRLTALCRRYGWALIADEVQTGIGRCGTMFAVERWDLEPDLLLLGKGFAGGVMPIGGTLGTERMMASATNHVGGTFAWTPAACEGALENIEAILRDDVLANVREMEGIALEVLTPLTERHEQVGDVRAAGGLVGVEFVTDMETIRPAPAFQLAVHHAALRRGVLGITQEGKWVYRLQPALNQPLELFRWSCERVAEAIDEVSAAPPPEGE
jgi:4-aminobutyrate aminotransferase-like enzyme